VLPVVTFGQFAHRGSREMLLGDNTDPKLVENLSNGIAGDGADAAHVLFHTTSDTTVPVENSVQFYMALRKAGAEMHITERGPQAWASGTDEALSSWPARPGGLLRVPACSIAAAK